MTGLALGGLLADAGDAMGAAARILAAGAAALALLALLRLLLIGLGRILSRRIARRPRLAAFMARRADRARFSGLASTALAAFFVSLLALYLVSVFRFLGSSGGAPADARIANLLHALRDDGPTAFFGRITALGGWRVLVPALLGATAALAALRRRDLLGGLWIAAAGNQLSVALLKRFFDRPRPAFGYFVETSGSFPSGHAAASVAVWGMLFYLAWRVRALPAAAAASGAVILALLIGASRVYLVEHYLSDVLNGYLLGGLWLIVGAAFCERRREAFGRETARRPLALALGAAVGGAAMALLLVATPPAPLNRITPPAPIPVASPLDVFASGDAPTGTETLTGAARQPINIIVAARDAPTLAAAMREGGWTPAPEPGPGALLRAFGAGFRLGFWPEFWNERPNDLAFTRSDNGPDGSFRLHLRFWRSGFSADGLEIFVGALAPGGPGGRAGGAPAPARLAAVIGALRRSGLVALSAP